MFEIIIDHVAPYLENLSKPEAIAVGEAINRLEREGNKLRMPLSKPLGHGLFELRPSRQRIIYFYWNGKVILTNGFKKETGKTPPQEIRQALNVKKLYK